MIGIVPAAGNATRLNGLPKMLLPIPDSTLFGETRRKMLICNIEHVVTGTRVGNLTFLQGLCDEKVELFEANTDTMSETVLRSRDHMPDPNEWVCFGMPDTYFDDENAFCKLHYALIHGADVAVGIFAARSEQHHKLGNATMVEHIVELVEKKAAELAAAALIAKQAAE